MEIKNQPPCFKLKDSINGLNGRFPGWVKSRFSSWILVMNPFSRIASAQYCFDLLLRVLLPVVIPILLLFFGSIGREDEVEKAWLLRYCREERHGVMQWLKQTLVSRLTEWACGKKDKP